MRFQTTKRILGRDPELVLGVLEECLRSLTPEIVRQGSQITMHGLGPSPRAINHRDTTVIDVQREDGATIVHADVRFQASAFLGTAAQDLVVQEKLDRVFDDLLEQLGIASPQSKLYKHESARSTEAFTGESELVAQQKPTETPVEEQPVAVTTAAAESMIAPDAMPEVVNETTAEVNAESLATEEPALAAEAENVTVSSEVEPEPSSEELVRREELPVVAAAEVADAAPGVNDAAHAIPAPIDNLDRQDLPQPADALSALETGPAEGVEIANEGAVDVARDAKVSASSRVEVAEARIHSADAEALPPVDLTTAETPPGIDAVEEKPVKTETPAEQATAESLPSAEAAKPTSAPVRKIEEPAKLRESAVKQTKPVAPVRKPEAPSSAASKAAAPASGSSSAKASKPKFSNVPAKPSPVPAPAFAEKGMFGVSAFDEEPEKSSRLLRWSAWIAALIVLVVAPLIWLYMPSHSESATASVNQPAASAAAPEPVTAPKQPGEDPDPAVVVDDWAAAMNSRDAAAQAGFYANPVERYFLRHNLSRNEVKADKQAAIDRRRGDWSVKMESIKVTRTDGKTARVRLIKHYTVKEDGKVASEWFVPSVLQMTNAKGRWRITSERDLGWATSLDELGY